MVLAHQVNVLDQYSIISFFVSYLWQRWLDVAIILDGLLYLVPPIIELYLNTRLDVFDFRYQLLLIAPNFIQPIRQRRCNRI